MRNNKKGFTIVELVIVIAVIAILAAVLIPTFSGVITKAQDSAALQEATGIYHSALANENIVTGLNARSASGADAYVKTKDGKIYSITDGVVDKATGTPTLVDTLPAEAGTHYVLASAVYADAEELAGVSIYLCEVVEND